MAKKLPPRPPLGNKYAVGHGCGRPPKYDLEKEAADLLEYSLKDECTSLEKFTFYKDYCADELADFAKRCAVFSLALKKAKERISQRRTELCNAGTMHQAVWNRTARLYSPRIRNEEEDTKDEDLKRKIKLLEYEAKLKAAADANKGVSPNDSILTELLSELKKK